MAQGKKYGGRTKGTPNKDVKQLRDSLTFLFENNIEQFEDWFNKVADKDPAKAIELSIRMAEYCIPKLNREITSQDEDNLVTYSVKFAE